MARVIVVGSINQDVTVTVDRFPTPGETLSGSSLTYGLGGKGANQAAAAARSGVPTLFVGAVGTDLAGQQPAHASRGPRRGRLPPARSRLPVRNRAHHGRRQRGEHDHPGRGRERARHRSSHAKASLFPAPSDIVVLQAEIPPAANAAAIEWAHSFGARVLLNLAPARATDAGDAVARRHPRRQRDGGRTDAGHARPGDAHGGDRRRTGATRHRSAPRRRDDGRARRGVGVGGRGPPQPRDHARRGRGHHGGRGRVRGGAGCGDGARQALRRGRGGRHPGGGRGGPRAGGGRLLREPPPVTRN